MLIVDIILYLLIAAYLHAVFPGEYGKAKHPLFIFKLSFWKHACSRDEDTGLARQDHFQILLSRHKKTMQEI